MSEQKLVSPLLDGFQMGDPISSHDGVRCCPAIKENSDNKYIIKILSIPASQNQLDALLLTGAFQDAAGALNYFKELADGVVREAQLHQQLSRHDGFVPCEGWQVVPMEGNQLGYDVYLLTPYRRTLERYLKKNPMTHLEAVNLGLDICAALAASRRAGHIYVDLKPSNIFISDDREYRIGDLGFMNMSSMKYAALPSKYRSCYTAPEMQDPLSTISDTADIYALGLILYQVYNDGNLPVDAASAAEELAPPANADYEMAEIILKACHTDPAQRWADPTQMGQALVAYMQRNTINDVPILPPVIADPVEEEPAEAESEAPAEEAAEETAAETTTEETAEAPAEDTPEDQAEPGEAPAESEEAPAEEAAEEEASEEEPAGEEPAAEEVPAEETAEEEPAEETAEEASPAEEVDPVAQELAEVYDMIADETLPDEENVQDLEDSQVSEETSAMLAQADELAAMEIPEGVVVPEAKLPEEEPAPEPEEAPEAPAAEEDEDEDEEGDDEIDIPIPLPDLTPVKKKGKKWLIAIILALLLGGLGYGAHYYYYNYYLVPVGGITLNGGTNEITAQIDVPLDESILTAVCTDTYGNATTSAVINGQATFTGLNPGMQYTVSLKVDGFYQLTGNHTASFTTTRQTNIVSISATTGAEDGSVILSFTVDGTDPENWTVDYSTEGQEMQTMSFTGHMVTIPGLTVGESYTFALRPTEESDVEVVGTNTLDFTVSKVVLAENVAIGSFNDGVMTVIWNAPADTQVAEWTIRCTDGGSYDQTLTVTDCTASFPDAEVGKTYSLEILAQGMTQSVRADVTPKLLTVTGVSCTPVGSTSLRVTWEYEGDAPAEGWTVTYTVGGGEIKTLTSDTNAADLSPVIPSVTYTVNVGGVESSYTAPAAGKFSGHGLSVSNLQYSLCVAPAASGWDHTKVTTYTTGFKADQHIGLVVYCTVTVPADNAETEILYLVKDASGKVITELASVKTMNWKDMWKDRYFYPTLPKNPTEPGRYTLEIYFDGALAITKDFSIQ